MELSRSDHGWGAWCVYLCPWWRDHLCPELDTSPFVVPPLGFVSFWFFFCFLPLVPR